MGGSECKSLICNKKFPNPNLQTYVVSQGMLGQGPSLEGMLSYMRPCLGRRQSSSMCSRGPARPCGVHATWQPCAGGMQHLTSLLQGQAALSRAQVDHSEALLDRRRLGEPSRAGKARLSVRGAALHIFSQVNWPNSRVARHLTNLTKLGCLHHKVAQTRAPPTYEESK